MLTKYRPSDLWACGPFVELQDELGRFLGDAWGAAGRSVPLVYRVDVREDADHVYVEADTLPDLADLPDGCIFRSRCDVSIELCARERPALDGGDHCSACHVAGR